MSELSNRDRINRILVAADASPNSFAALRAAIDLAKKMQAEVLGVFIEDTSLFRLGNLPFIQETGVFTGSSRSISSRQIRQQLRAQSKKARIVLEKLAEEARVRWTYRVLQGSTTADLKEAAADADLIVLGRSGWSGRRRLGSTVQSMLSHNPARILIIGDTPSPKPPILVIYDGSESSIRALESASKLLRDSSGFLTVGILAETPGLAKRLQREAFRRLRKLGIEPRFRWILNWSVQKINYLANSENCLLVLPRSIEPVQEKSVSDVIDELECPVLLIK